MLYALQQPLKQFIKLFVKNFKIGIPEGAIDVFCDNKVAS